MIAERHASSSPLQTPARRRRKPSPWPSVAWIGVGSGLTGLAWLLVGLLG